MVATMRTYTVTAERGRSGRWLLQCVEFPGAISESRGLDAAPDLMREAIAFVAEVAPEEVEIRLVPALPERVGDQVAAAREAVDQLASMQRETAELSRLAVRALVEECGLSGRDAAAVLGVSPQRVSQLVNS